MCYTAVGGYGGSIKAPRVLLGDAEHPPAEFHSAMEPPLTFTAHFPAYKKAGSDEPASKLFMPLFS